MLVQSSLDNFRNGFQAESMAFEMLTVRNAQGRNEYSLCGSALERSLS